jgi:hypothetical protein
MGGVTNRQHRPPLDGYPLGDLARTSHTVGVKNAVVCAARAAEPRKEQVTGRGVQGQGAVGVGDDASLRGG